MPIFFYNPCSGGSQTLSASGTIEAKQTQRLTLQEPIAAQLLIHSFLDRKPRGFRCHPLWSRTCQTHGLGSFPTSREDTNSVQSAHAAKNQNRWDFMFGFTTPQFDRNLHDQNKLDLQERRYVQQQFPSLLKGELALRSLRGKQKMVVVSQQVLEPSLASN